MSDHPKSGLKIAQVLAARESILGAALPYRIWALPNSLPFKKRSPYLWYGEGSSFDQFNWYSRDGTVFGSLEPIIDFQQFTLSPDGRHLALNSFHQHATGSLWLIDIATNTTTALATDPHAQSDPL